MDRVEKSGKTVDEAVAEAIRVLDATIDEVEVTVLEEAVKGFLGIGSKPARVLVVRKFDPVYAAKQFIRETTAAMGISVAAEIEFDEKHMNINLVGSDMGVLIGKRGQTLDSFQYLINLVVNKGSSWYISVTLDTENYRKRRKDTLESLAHNLAKKVKQTKRSVTLEPMNPYERRIIHSCLQGDKQVTTYSEGEDPFRNVVIAYKK